MEKNTTPPSSKAMKKERSLKSLFSFFKPSKHGKKPLKSHYPNKPSTKAMNLSTSSLPAQTSTKDEDSGNLDNDSPREAGHWHSTTSLPSQTRPPFARHSPTSSASSASSFEFTSEGSTAATSPSNSSPSILVKSFSSASVATTDSATSVSSSSAEHDSQSPQVSVKSPKTTKVSKRVTDSYQKQPSPLSSVIDAHSPYVFPVPPQLPTQDYQMRRRSSLGKFLLRRSQSHPDLADLTQADLPPLPPMPTVASSPRPTSSASPISRAKTFRRKFSDHRKSDGFGGYTDQEKIERISILGADPAGHGYYLYPTSEKEASNQRNSGMGPRPGKRGKPGHVGDFKDGWGGSGPDGLGSSRGNRTWKDSRGRGFRKTVTQQAIPEEASDVFDSEGIPQPSRRFSEGSALSSHYSQNTTLENPISLVPDQATTRSDTTQSEEHKQNPHNDWDSIQEHRVPLQVPSTETKVPHDWDRDDEAVLRRLKQGADSAIEGLNGRAISFPHPEPGGSDEQTNIVEIKDSLPIVRIEMVEAGVV